jgi:class 3 adenylate cyclase
LAVAKLQKRNLANPDEVRSVGRGKLELVEIGDTAIGRIQYDPGWRWSDDVRPIVGGELCDVRHVGVCLSGRLRIEMADGSTMEIGAFDAYEVPPAHDAWVIGDEPWISIDSQGRRYFAKLDEAADRRTLATILLTDIVSSTELVAQLGDFAWRDRLAQYHVFAQRTLERFRGREVGTTGDGILALFDSPARAVRCAVALAAGAPGVGVGQRAGLHTGDVDMAGDDIRGIAVHTAARVAAAAGPGDVFMSATTNALLSGSGVTTTSRGLQQLKGIEQPVELFAVEIGQLADE